MSIPRTTKLLVEPPSSATGDIAFNLIVFFLVCASVQPDSGRKQTMPASETTQEEEQTENIQVTLKRTVLLVNDEVTTDQDLFQRLKRLLDQKTSPDQKVVVVKSDDDAPYSRWIFVTAQIEDAGGTVTIQVEEEREVSLPE